MTTKPKTLPELLQERWPGEWEVSRVGRSVRRARWESNYAHWVMWSYCRKCTLRHCLIVGGRDMQRIAYGPTLAEAWANLMRQTP